jgi:hypothetical protein
LDTILSREEVFAVINGERDYQDTLALTSETDGYHTVTEFLLYIDDYVREAKTVVSRTWGPEATQKGLDLIRKITTLGVACMEQNGAFERSFKIRLLQDMGGSLHEGRELAVGDEHGTPLWSARDMVRRGLAEVVR